MRLGSALVGGTQYVDLAMCDRSQFSFGINGEIGSASLVFKSPVNPFTMQFTPEFGPEMLRLACSQEIIVADVDGNRIFGGRVSKFAKGLMGKVGVEYKIDCQDYTVLLDAAYVIGGTTVTTAVFTEQSDSSIIRTLFSQLLPDWDLTHVHHVLDVPESNFEGKTLLGVLQMLREATNAHWYVFPGYKRLYYFSSGEYVAPFELDELAVSPSGIPGGALFGGSGQFGGDTLFGGGDFDAIKAVQWLQQGMRYETEAQRPANRVTVRGKWVDDVLNQFLVDAAAGGSATDGYAGQRKSLVWPPVLLNPSEGNYYDTDELEGIARQSRYMEGEFTYYDASVILLEFDTAALAIPEDATIESATLRLAFNFVNNDILYGAEAWIGIEYITPVVIFGTSYTHEQSNSAWGYERPVSQAFALRNPNDNINRTGSTGFRIHLKLSQAPQEVNEFRVYMQEAAGAGQSPPSLQIAYRTLTEGTRIQVTVEDAAAIAALATDTDDGVRFRFIRNDKILTEETATMRAQYELNNFPSGGATNGSLALLREGLDIGQVVRINSPSLGFEEHHLITRRTTAWFGGSRVLTITGIEFGAYRPGFEVALKRMERALQQVGAL